MRWFSVRPSLTFKGRKFKGLRGWAGKPTHPPLTDIPIGAYVIVPVFDLISRWQGDGEVGRNMFVAATYVLIAGGIVSVPTMITGLWDWWISTPRGTQAWRTANTHLAIMAFNAIVVLVNILTRLGDFDMTASTPTFNLALSVVIGLLVSVGAAYGGTLVYDYEFNVEQDKGYAWSESERDYLPGEKPDTEEPHA